ncbi:hypothetical protein Moror_6953 [Moniliophthora roreri MCA 2997]|uniref:Cation/H+ exchanger transmembrane domain-containing protein n=1 Tax=Moniliophthora roreri (strain MCA 2997) TaxID=1381753 RepID=V2XV51_MONRO|nr:hypothetical protein Moror_6953 [Moniliophthora roreri MCA 2997]
MAIEVVEVSSPSLAYVVLGGFTVAFSMVSLFVKEKLYINEVFLGTAFGIMMGPHGANLFDPRSWGMSQEKVTLEVMRVVLATSLFIIGVELPKNYIYKHMKGLLVMVVPTMAIGWGIIAGSLKLLFPRLEFISCLAISACLTPTDPIICAAIVGGKFAIRYVPIDIRHFLSAESAANDGLAFPFLTVALYLTLETSTRVAIGKWFLVGWLYQVILGVILGAVLGTVFRHLMKLSHKKGFINKEAYLAQQLALALLTMGVASTIGSDDLLAAFAAGSAISWDGDFNTHIENEAFASIIDFVLNCACFLYIGAWLPFESWHSPTLGTDVWRLVVLFVVVMFLRRIPAILMLYRWVPEIKNWREALFCGHFGPMGVGAVFVSSLALSKLPEPASPPQSQAELLAAIIQPIVAFIVLGSIIVHGVSVVLLSFTLGLRARSRTLTLVDQANVLPGLDIARDHLRATGYAGAQRRSSFKAINADPDPDAASVRSFRATIPSIPEVEPAAGPSSTRASMINNAKVLRFASREDVIGRDVTDKCFAATADEQQGTWNRVCE